MRPSVIKRYLRTMLTVTHKGCCVFVMDKNDIEIDNEVKSRIPYVDGVNNYCIKCPICDTKWYASTYSVDDLINQYKKDGALCIFDEDIYVDVPLKKQNNE